MSEATATQKLNTRYTELPRAFYGKTEDKKDAKAGAARFVPASGRKRFTATKILMLSLISSERKMYGGTSKIPYSSVMSEFGMSKPTVSKNFNELIRDNILKSEKQSEYEIIQEFSDKRSLKIYHFLRQEELDLGGTVRRLGYNEVLLLCEVIRHYLNPERKQKYFVGGEKRVSTLLNISKSAASELINRLLKTKALYRNVRTIDSAKQEIVKEGVGRNRNELTAFIVNSELLERCRRIDEANKSMRDVKRLFKAHGNTPKPNAGTVCRRSRGSNYSVSEEWKVNAGKLTNEEKFDKIDTAFMNDMVYKNLKQHYVKINSAWLTALLSKNSKGAEGFEAELNSVLDELDAFLIERGVPPGEIPEDIGRYIK